jgi:hypothetical protein
MVTSRDAARCKASWSFYAPFWATFLHFAVYFKRRAAGGDGDEDACGRDTAGPAPNSLNSGTNKSSK